MEARRGSAIAHLRFLVRCEESEESEETYQDARGRMDFLRILRFLRSPQQISQRSPALFRSSARRYLFRVCKSVPRQQRQGAPDPACGSMMPAAAEPRCNGGSAFGEQGADEQQKQARGGATVESGGDVGEPNGQ